MTSFLMNEFLDGLPLPNTLAGINQLVIILREVHLPLANENPDMVISVVRQSTFLGTHLTCSTGPGFGF